MQDLFDNNMQIKTVYVNKLSFDFADFDFVKSRQIIIIYIFILRIFKH